MNDLRRANIDAAIYINLDERKDKRDLLERRFKELNIEVERFSAVRASKPLYSNFKTPFLGSRKEQQLPRSGCDQSHWSVLTELWKREVDCALVFEDDVLLPGNFVDGVIRIKQQLPEGWWAVRLGWHDGLGKVVLEQTGKNVGKIKKPCCTNSILYSKEGIEQIRRRMMLPYGIIEETFWLMESEGTYPIYAASPEPLTGICDLTSDITGQKPFKGRNQKKQESTERKVVPRLGKKTPKATEVQPAKTEPVKQEPVKQEPVKQEPVKQEPVEETKELVQEQVVQEQVVQERAKEQVVSVRRTPERPQSTLWRRVPVTAPKREQRPVRRIGELGKRKVVEGQ